MTNNNIKVVLSLGANLGNRQETLASAVVCLQEAEICSECHVSAFYETSPVGYEKQPDFLNIAVSGVTNHTPETLLFLCKSIEYLFGRKPRARWHQRELDIDIIYYGKMIIKNATMEIPHPRMHERSFVLRPLAEIEPELLHPVLKLNTTQLLAQL
jgi:2-amino-4-hydroxy-6-hydroxymethyldihydropteridine diphosphokinase